MTIIMIMKKKKMFQWKNYGVQIRKSYKPMLQLIFNANNFQITFPVVKKSSKSLQLKLMKDETKCLTLCYNFEVILIYLVIYCK